MMLPSDVEGKNRSVGCRGRIVTENISALCHSFRNRTILLPVF